MNWEIVFGLGLPMFLTGAGALLLLLVLLFAALLRWSCDDIG